MKVSYSMIDTGSMMVCLFRVAAFGVTVLQERNAAEKEWKQKETTG